MMWGNAHDVMWGAQADFHTAQDEAQVEYDGPCGFDQLFSRNVPHLLEKIFFYLDYESFITCRAVSRYWSELLTSGSYQMKAQSVFKMEIDREEHRLLVACRDDNKELIARILSSGLVSVDCEGPTPLIVAIYHRNHSVVQFLLQRGADPNKAITDQNREITPQLIASLHKNVEAAQLLLNGGAYIDRTEVRGGTALHFAARIGDIIAVRLLIEGGADPNKIDDGGETSLSHASRLGHMGARYMCVINFLIEAGADEAFN